MESLGKPRRGGHAPPRRAFPAPVPVPRRRVSRLKARQARTPLVPRPIETLVVSGGGMKGLAALGAVSTLRRAGMLGGLKVVMGTSAGALVAAALALDRAELGLVQGLSPFRSGVDVGGFGTAFGLDNGAGLDAWIAELLGERADITFAQIRQEKGLDLVVCVTNVTDRCVEYLGPETHGGMRVALALRMSCTIPLYFPAVRHDGKLYVDGGVGDNFPMARAFETTPHTLGIAFAPRAVSMDMGLESYVAALLECATRCGQRHPLHHSPRYVMQLDTNGASSYDFGMSRAAMRRLFFAGARQARVWLKKHA